MSLMPRAVIDNFQIEIQQTLKQLRQTSPRSVRFHLHMPKTTNRQIDAIVGCRVGTFWLHESIVVIVVWKEC
jgi:hypothetical protein